MDVESFFGSEGPLAGALEGYEARPEQGVMARAVQGTLGEGGRLMVEAGCGVGKSFAYLVPAAEFAVEKRRQVIVTTHTINLQEQLVAKDIPFLQKVFPKRFSAVLAKGRGNY
ncbi:MAG: hypothetical protein ACYS47_13350, partial [Planctomycetota bacterium]